MNAHRLRCFNEGLKTWWSAASRRFQIALLDAAFAACVFLYLAIFIAFCLFVWWAFKWIVLAIAAWLMFLGLQRIQRAW